MEDNIIYDPKYMGIPNINFSVTDPYDDREPKYSKQRIKRGFDNSELWSLDSTIASFIYPRLKEFIKTNYGWPGRKTKDEWHKELKIMLYAFKFLASDEKYDVIGNTPEGKKIWKKVNKGLRLFSDNFTDLWI